MLRWSLHSHTIYCVFAMYVMLTAQPWSMLAASPRDSTLCMFTTQYFPTSTHSLFIPVGGIGHEKLMTLLNRPVLKTLYCPWTLALGSCHCEDMAVRNICLHAWHWWGKATCTYHSAGKCYKSTSGTAQLFLATSTAVFLRRAFLPGEALLNLYSLPPCHTLAHWPNA